MLVSEVAEAMTDNLGGGFAEKIPTFALTNDHTGWAAIVRNGGNFSGLGSHGPARRGSQGEDYHLAGFLRVFHECIHAIQPHASR